MTHYVLGAFLYLVAIVAHAGTTASQLKFKDHGKEVQTNEQSKLETLSPAQNWTIYEPHEKRERTYRVIPFNQLMDKIYGTQWRKAEEILFTCSDGYQPSIPTAKFLKYDAGIAFPANATDTFELVNTLQNNEKILLGPYYLVWNNSKSPDLKKEGASDIPYQLVGIDLISFSEKFPKLFPGKNTSSSVKAGFLHFRKYCLNCHTINKEGGGKAPELNVPMNATEYWQSAALKKWIINPSSVRWNTPMPGLSEELGDRRNIVASEIIEYLKAMKNNKKQ